MPAIPSPRTNKRPRIEIIPFIDIMFFLLATFMMVSLKMIEDSGIPINLPVSTSSDPQPRDDAFRLSVNEQGIYFLNGEAVPDEELLSKLESIKRQTSEPKFFLQGDAGTDFQYIVHGLDALRKAGISKIAIETKPTSSGL